jgi:hypothetical protein
MNDQNKKKIYIGVIAVCVLVTGYVIYNMTAGGGEAPDVTTAPVGTPTTAPGTQTTPRTTTAARAVDPSTIEYVAPSVFPNDNKFQTQVLNSGKYQELSDYPEVTLTPEEISKEDPFAPF